MGGLKVAHQFRVDVHVTSHIKDDVSAHASCLDVGALPEVGCAQEPDPVAVTYDPSFDFYERFLAPVRLAHLCQKKTISLSEISQVFDTFTPLLNCPVLQATH